MKQKVAVVTGGTSGMGLGVAKMLVSKGYYVFSTYVGQDFTEQITLRLSRPIRPIVRMSIDSSTM